MSPSNIETIKYGRYEIKAGMANNKARALAYLRNKKVCDAEDNTVESVISKIKTILDDLDSNNNSARRAPHIGTVTDYVNAFMSLDIAESRLAMLKAHAKAPQQIMSLQQLADAAGYKDYSAATLQYGTLAKDIIAFCGLKIRQEESWSIEVATCSSAEFVHADGTKILDTGPHPDWAWQMHPEVLEALKKLNMD